jgi:periplasmic divalent cation tolerance protein
VESGAEALMVMKTKRSLVREVIAAVKAAHSYKVCEVIAVAITAGNKPYLTWIDQSCRGGRKK